jgi:hypothetical protein
MALAAEMKTQMKYLAVQFAITLALYFAFDVPLGYTAPAVFVGWPVVGTVVTVDDDLPGGWSNPDGTVALRGSRRGSGGCWLCASASQCWHL